MSVIPFPRHSVRPIDRQDNLPAMLLAMANALEEHAAESSYPMWMRAMASECRRMSRNGVER